jgi:hypothetical protein
LETNGNLISNVRLINQRIALQKSKTQTEFGSATLYLITSPEKYFESILAIEENDKT